MCGVSPSTTAFRTASAVLWRTDRMTVYSDLRSTSVTNALRWPLPITVSPSQSPNRRLLWVLLGDAHEADPGGRADAVGISQGWTGWSCVDEAANARVSIQREIQLQVASGLGCVNRW